MTAQWQARQLAIRQRLGSWVRCASVARARAMLTYGWTEEDAQAGVLAETTFFRQIFSFLHH